MSAMTTAAVFSEPGGGVLIASPSTSLREQVLHSLPDAHGLVQQASGGADALVQLETGNWQVLFLDRRLPDLDAEELLQIIRTRFPGIQVVPLDSDSGHALPLSPANERGFGWAQADGIAPAAYEAGLGNTTRPATRARSIPFEAPPLPGMIGRAESMRRLYRMARLVAARTTTVLIIGATGTGKELVARAVHQLSPRTARPFVVVNCAAIPEPLLESELFGYTRGAFTGAVQSHLGRVQAAQGGTLFLDEVSELPLSLQPKLLRFLEQREVQRLGSTETLRVDVRVLAATNAPLAQWVEECKFRADLYYRLTAFPLQVPPLAQRVEDIVALAEHFLRAGAEGASPPYLTPPAIRLLQSHVWTGNVRELQQVMERASILAEDGDRIEPEHLFFSETIERGTSNREWPLGEGPSGAR